MDPMDHLCWVLRARVPHLPGFESLLNEPLWRNPVGPPNAALFNREMRDNISCIPARAGPASASRALSHTEQTFTILFQLL